MILLLELLFHTKLNSFYANQVMGGGGCKQQPTVNCGDGQRARTYISG